MIFKKKEIREGKGIFNCRLPQFHAIASREKIVMDMNSRWKGTRARYLK